jgi:ubiquinone/menaquinone biosynthesis C-methylase UbiE
MCLAFITPRMTTLTQDLQQFADSSVDAVTCTFGLMFMPDWQKDVKRR